MSDFDVYGLGNGIMDILLSVSEEEFSQLELKKGSMQLVDSDVQRALISRFGGRELKLCSGGSAANTAIAVAQLGGKAAYCCSLADDDYGEFYRQEFKELGIELPAAVCNGKDSGTSVVLITPDSERTMQTSLGAAASLTPDHLEESKIASSKWLYVEGYLLADPENGQSVVKRAVEIAKRNHVPVAVTFSDPFIVTGFNDTLRWVVENSSLIFANSDEAMAYTGRSDAKSAFADICKVVPNAVVTMSEQGALVRFQEEDLHVPAFPCTPVDMTGAGDMFAGAFLYGVARGADIRTTARAAAYLAMKVICQVGARMEDASMPRLWQESQSTQAFA